MRTKIVKPAVKKAAKFLQSTLVSADFLKPKKTKISRVTDWQTEQDVDDKAELPNPTKKADKFT